jgi:preprotein translocase subunit Sec63
MLSDRVLDEHLDRIDYYTLLGVARDAAPLGIRDAFHRFAMRFHPDQHIGDDGAQARAGRIFKRGAEGYRAGAAAARREAPLRARERGL